MSDDYRTAPQIVSLEAWQRSLEDFTTREKAMTRQIDALNAARRRLPMTKVDKSYEFVGVEGTRNLLELFDERRQLIVYHFMFAPEWEEGCPGCSWVVDAMTHPAHIQARDTSLVLISRAELLKLQAYRRRMGWNLPWYSSHEANFNVDMGATVDGEEHHGLSVFLRQGNEIYRTYYTGRRGVEHLGSHWTYLDLTPFGRQESWEDSPPGWPQSDPYSWQRRHDAYD